MFAFKHNHFAAWCCLGPVYIASLFITLWYILWIPLNYKFFLVPSYITLPFSDMLCQYSYVFTEHNKSFGQLLQHILFHLIDLVLFIVHRGASRGCVWLSWQSPLYCRHSALKPIKYQTLSKTCHCRSLIWVVWNRQQHFPSNTA